MFDLDRRTSQSQEASRADLSVDALDFLTQYGLHPAPETYLAHGYVDLCLMAWPTAGGFPLRLAMRWALWTWTTDDLLDGDLRTAPPEVIERLTRSLLCVGADGVEPAPDDHPVVHALAGLIRQTRMTMPDFWWQRYREQLDAWIVAARDKLVHYLQPGRTPTLREYLMLRPADGGMLLAAMWCELADQCITPHWTDPMVRDLLDAFSTCGILANDLAGGSGEGETFNAVAARMADGDLSEAQARRDVSERLEAEERRFRWLYQAVRRGFPAGPPPAVATTTSPPGDLVLDTHRFVLLLDQFRVALSAWTDSSARYPVPGAPRPVRRALHNVLISPALRTWRAVGLCSWRTRLNGDASL
ncbi:terpene synthase family protein [Kitasatospora sp. LaBMicrA B282]|uniref:terpene synthase family protein n=1 Tax=Kitasatospora sp. LaBMicrA B282 TaxID=3420949 RepID=UPI003D0ECF66